MARMIAIYKTPKDTDAFDKHYFEVHMPLAKKLPGLIKYDVGRSPIISTTGHSDTYCIGTLHFDSLDAIKAAFAWSPCTRAMMKRKRKSKPDVDEIEDGARATITEEAISLMIFNKAKQKHFFQEQTKIFPSVLSCIKEMTSSFEVSVRSKKDWENAILKGYSLFREVVKNNGGKIHFDMLTQSAIYENQVHK